MKTTQQMKEDFFMAIVNNDIKKYKSKQFYIDINKIKNEPSYTNTIEKSSTKPLIPPT
jgi:hypothetical protein